MTFNWNTKIFDNTGKEHAHANHNHVYRNKMLEIGVDTVIILYTKGFSHMQAWLTAAERPNAGGDEDDMTKYFVFDF